MTNFEHYQDCCHKYSRRINDLFEKKFIIIPITYKY